MRLTVPQKNFLWNVIWKRDRGFIAYGDARKTARALARRKLICLAPHRIVFWHGEKERPWVITARGMFAYHGFKDLQARSGGKTP